jgi:hypothetical protein
MEENEEGLNSHRRKKILLNPPQYGYVKGNNGTRPKKAHYTTILDGLSYLKRGGVFKCIAISVGIKYLMGTLLTA